MTPRGIPTRASAALALEPREPVGLLACGGRFPVVFAEKARECGIPVVCIGAAGMADPGLRNICTRFSWLRRMSLGRIIHTFRRAGVRRWTMAGKFEKRLLFHPWRWFLFVPDWRIVRFWFFRRRKANNDDALLLGLIDEFRREGLECVSALDLCPEKVFSPAANRPLASSATSHSAGNWRGKWAGSTSARA
jgi:DUF1009 family protein